MTLRTMLTDEVILIRRAQSVAGVDEYNDPIVIDQSYTDRCPALLEQTSSQEFTVGQDRVLSDWQVFLPPDVVLDHLDRVYHGSSTFEVVGTPSRPMKRSGALMTVARLRLLEGG